MDQFSLFHSLHNRAFARLYASQTINLIGDALTWVGLALLSFELAGKEAGSILSIALTLRVTAFVCLSPLAGALADRHHRKFILVFTHLGRMGLVCLLPFVAQTWQLYGIVLLLSSFSAFFTPTYTATIPLVAGEKDYPEAIALSSATYQFLGVLGPGLAGSVAAFVGARQIFFLDALTFAIAAGLISTISGNSLANITQPTAQRLTTIADMRLGTACLWIDPVLRYVLLMQLVAAIVGAQILVNTVGYVQGTLQLGKLEYGWVMAAFGIGATLASVALGHRPQPWRKTTLTLVGAALMAIALLPADRINLGGLMVMWVLAGVGQILVNVPTQTLIADRIPTEFQGRVYGAQFAWSHFWWLLAYPLAGWMGRSLPTTYFLWSGLAGGGLLLLLHSVLIWLSRLNISEQNGVWHSHDHIHNEHHLHHHPSGGTTVHSHLHFHLKLPSMSGCIQDH
jgi:MFS transporter, NRE family, putaive nickel resistance protein